MRIRLPELCTGALVTLALATAPAWAQAASDEAAPAEAAPAADPAAPAAADDGDGVDPEKRVVYGAAIRLRSVRAPQGILELFVERAPGGSSNTGVGVEFIRRRGDVELQFGIEYERIQPTQGVWIDKGTNVAAGDEADYIVSPERAPDEERLGWLTFEFTFLNHAPINKYVSFRYGGGAGIGIITGGLYRYDVLCTGATNASPEPGCVPAQFGGTGIASGPVKYELPPVFPVVNAILGVQIKPTKGLVVNVEGGIRTFPFFGVSTGYFF